MHYAATIGEAKGFVVSIMGGFWPVVSKSSHFYRAMHYSAYRGHAIACRQSVYVCDVGGPGPHRLKILETNCANN